ncbi:hypothetical protein [Sphingobacterium sp.]|uniref:hypothetical protein n=1 Tax=Sphingobacterium sp. TaxID=341027 RepID=UPI0028A6AC11|nr:hypothetical protein [Sphingobacterium sp.]
MKSDNNKKNNLPQNERTPSKDMQPIDASNDSGAVPPFLPKGEESNIPKKFHPKNKESNGTPRSK